MKKLISSKHLESVSDLTLCAPIKQGFIDAFEAVTYETRLQQMHERPVPDPRRRRASIRRSSRSSTPPIGSRRCSTSGSPYSTTEPRRLLLSATFDRPFEPYMRLIWDPLGPLLDVIFCNCEGYVTATEHSFEDYLAWVRRSQIDTDFFYAASGHQRHRHPISRPDREAAARGGTALPSPRR